MIKSMTGYGLGTAEGAGKISPSRLKLSIRAIATAERINRGKVDIYINVENTGEADSIVTVNKPLAKAYLDALRELGAELEIQSNANAETFLRIPDVFTVEKAPDDMELITSTVLCALEEALNGFDEMRVAEGEKLVCDLKEHLAFIDNATGEVEKRSPRIVEEYRARIEERMRDILGSATYDETRLLTEVAIFSDKVNVNEETVRLRSHIAQFTNMLDEGGSVGRKIDFLIQEMNREINTIGSKSNDLDVARIVIDVKAEIEKLREQIQNIE